MTRPPPRSTLFPLHDALPISVLGPLGSLHDPWLLAELPADLLDHRAARAPDGLDRQRGARDHARSEEHTSELQSQSNLVCRLLLEKKKLRKEFCACVSPHRGM